MRIILHGKETVELVLNADEVAKMLDGESVEKRLSEESSVDFSLVETWLVSACA